MHVGMCFMPQDATLTHPLPLITSEVKPFHACCYGQHFDVKPFFFSSFSYFFSSVYWLVYVTVTHGEVTDGH